jgi:TPR repeat protein
LGRGIAYDPIKAMQFYKQGCDLKDPAACKLLETYPQQFVDLSRESCRVDRAGNGCHNLGLAYLAGIGVTADRKRARELFEKSCDLGDRGGCNRLAEMYTGEWGEPADWAKVYAIYEKQCEGRADGAACNELGYYVEAGKGGKADAARALTLYQRGCGLDDFASCENLASTYEATDKAKATELHAKAASLKEAMLRETAAKEATLKEGPKQALP